MDHFCPWAGGIVSETNFKYFVQFVIYAAIYCLFVLVVMAYYLSKAAVRGSVVNWAVTVGM